MKSSIKGPQQLVAPVPQNDNLRFFLTIFRRMGTHGPRDAVICNAMMQRFGGGYRQPYLLMQALMVDLSRHCRLTLTIAPCCCRQITTDEAQLLAVFAASEANPQRALLLLSDLTGNRECHGLLSTIEAIRTAFFGLGCDLTC